MAPYLTEYVKLQLQLVEDGGIKIVMCSVAELFGLRFADFYSGGACFERLSLYYYPD
jgi:hypothetical protein